MPKNKVANFVADFLYLRHGEKVCEAILEAIEEVRKEGEDPQKATLKDLEDAIKHVFGVPGSYDELKEAWLAIDPDSPIQAVFISGKKKDRSGGRG